MWGKYWGNGPQSPGNCVFSPCIMCFQYIGGCSVHRGYHDACGGYHEYIGGCSVHQEDIMSTSGDIMSTSGDIMSTLGDVQYIGVFNRN